MTTTEVLRQTASDMWVHVPTGTTITLYGWGGFRAFEVTTATGMPHVADGLHVGRRPLTAALAEVVDRIERGA